MAMGDRIKPHADKAKGKIKQMVGKASGNRDLEDEGRVDELGADARQAAQKTGDAVKDVIKPD